MIERRRQNPKAVFDAMLCYVNVNQLSDDLMADCLTDLEKKSLGHPSDRCPPSTGRNLLHCLLDRT